MPSHDNPLSQDLCDDFHFCGGLCEYIHCKEDIVKYDNDDLRTGFTFAASVL